MPGNWIREGERTYLLEAMLFKQVILGKISLVIYLLKFASVILFSDHQPTR
jgi:hypothetical protein